MKTTLAHVCKGWASPLIFAVAVFACAPTADAAPVTDDQAAAAVSNWLMVDPTMDLGLSGAVKDVRAVNAPEGVTPFHVVRLENGGFVVTTGDTLDEPFIAFSDSDDLEESD